MKIAFFGTQKVWVPAQKSRGTHQRSSFIYKYDMECFNAVNSEYSDLKFTFFDVLLDESTAQLAAGHDALCIFVSDICNEPVLQKLSSLGVVRSSTAPYSHPTHHGFFSRNTSHYVVRVMAITSTSKLLPRSASKSFTLHTLPKQSQSSPSGWYWP